MSSRYFVAAPIETDRAVLADAEAHHLLHVMRARAGDEVTLFDGTGSEFTAHIERLGRSDVELAIVERRSVDRELAISLTLGVALPKGDRQAWLVEKATELGVTRLVPLVTDHGVAQPTDKALERLRRGVIEASKQCGRNRLMRIAEAQPWADFVAQSPATACRLIAHVDASQNEPTSLPKAQEYIVAIGPEGGFTDAEVAAALHAGWQAISLGARILRVETAAIAVAANLAMAF
jgi:16S rRNA (uracil1498-N3)-methyltransferase